MEHLGSPEAIQVAQQTIPEALKDLEKCIDETKQLENAAVALFKDQTSQLFTIVGPQWKAFVDEKAELLSQMTKLQETYERINRELSHQKGIDLSNHSFLLQSDILTSLAHPKNNNIKTAETVAYQLFYIQDTLIQKIDR